MNEQSIKKAVLSLEAHLQSLRHRHESELKVIKSRHKTEIAALEMRLRAMRGSNNNRKDRSRMN